MSATSPRPNLEQRKKQAKDLRKAHKAADSDAARRIQRHLPRLRGRSVEEILQAPLSLQEAQHIVAREGGFASWRQLHAAAVGRDLSYDADWRARFSAAYHLKPGIVLRRVPPPFIPERLDYFLAEEPRQAAVSPDDPPEVFFFDWDNDGLRGRGLGYLEGWGFTLEQSIRHVLELATYEYEGPTELLALRMPGDWIQRRGTPTRQRLGALAEISRRELGAPFDAELICLDRTVIVASGELSFTPLRADTPDTLFMFLDQEELGHPDGGGGSGACSLSDLLRVLGNRAGLAVQNRVTNDFSTEMHVRHLSSSALWNKEGRLAQLPALLRNVSAQTGLQFTIETNSVPVWKLQPVV